MTSRYSVRIVLQSETLDFPLFRDTYSLFVEADECSTLGSVLLRYEANAKDFPTKEVGGALGLFLWTTSLLVRT